MRVHLKGGRFGLKSLEQMLNEDHLRALVRALSELGFTVTGGPIPKNPDIEVHIEAQKTLHSEGVPLVCVQLENRFIWPGNTTENLNRYQHLVTWDRSLSGHRVTHIFPPISIREPRHNSYSERPTLAAIVATNRAENSLSPDELYSERVRIIRAFELRPSIPFELWGRGWNLPPQPSGLFFSGVYKMLRGFPFEISHLNNYQGPCDNKDDALARAKFNFCFENVSGLKGYLTEKIFDSLIAGAVPIYAGCEDISEYVPKECYIAYQRGCSIDTMIGQLQDFGQVEYEKFNNARLEFIASKSFHNHSLHAFAKKQPPP